MNGMGWIIVIIGVLIAIVGLRGTQKQVFPWFFGSTSSNNNSGNPTPVNGKCPNGYVFYNNTCQPITGI